MNDFLQAYGPGEVEVVYTHNDEMALGVVAGARRPPAGWTR